MDLLAAMTLARLNGISPSNLHPLLALLADPPLNPSQIAKRCGLSCGAVTQLLDNLRKLKLIEPAPNPPDRRVKKVLPTKEAFELFAPIVEELENSPRPA